MFEHHDARIVKLYVSILLDYEPIPLLHQPSHPVVKRRWEHPPAKPLKHELFDL
jgi:hypothetical protein